MYKCMHVYKGFIHSLKKSKTKRALTTNYLCLENMTQKQTVYCSPFHS